MSNTDLFLQHLDSVLGDCAEIIEISGRASRAQNRFFELTMDKLKKVLDKCYDMKLSILKEMEEDIRFQIYKP